MFIGVLSADRGDSERGKKSWHSTSSNKSISTDVHLVAPYSFMKTWAKSLALRIAPERTPWRDVLGGILHSVLVSGEWGSGAEYQNGFRTAPISNSGDICAPENLSSRKFQMTREYFSAFFEDSPSYPLISRELPRYNRDYFAYIRTDIYSQQKCSQTVFLFLKISRRFSKMLSITHNAPSNLNRQGKFRRFLIFCQKFLPGSDIVKNFLAGEFGLPTLPWIIDVTTHHAYHHVFRLW